MSNGCVCVCPTSIPTALVVVQDLHLHPAVFEEQYNTFHAHGYAHAPGGGFLVGKVDGSADQGAAGDDAKR